MSTRCVLTPYAVEFGSGGPFPQLTYFNAANPRPVLGFDDTANEAGTWTLAVPSDGLTAPLVLVISYVISVITGTVIWTAQVEAISAGDALDLGAATSYGSSSSVTSTVPGTAGYLAQATITISDMDSAAAGDYLRVQIGRNAASDTATTDASLLCAELRDSA